MWGGWGCVGFGDSGRGVWPLGGWLCSGVHEFLIRTSYGSRRGAPGRWKGLSQGRSGACGIETSPLAYPRPSMGMASSREGGAETQALGMEQSGSGTASRHLSQSRKDQPRTVAFLPLPRNKLYTWKMLACAWHVLGMSRIGRGFAFMWLKLHTSALIHEMGICI